MKADGFGSPSLIVLGLNAFGHDAAAVLLRDGRPVFAASQERYDRRRQSAAFPADAVEAALAHEGLDPRQVDVVAFPWTRGMARGRKALHLIRHLPRSLAFLRERPEGGLPGRWAYLRAMAGLERRLRATGLRARVLRVPHHAAHAVSASLALPDRSGAVLTADGMGEWTTMAAWLLRDGVPTCLRRAGYPHSPGKAYAAVTQWLGFRPERDEGKTMGLAAYGDPGAPPARFAQSLLEPHPRRLVRIAADRFGFVVGRARLYGEAFLRALGPARRPDEDLRPGDRDVARGIQDAVERVALAAARSLLDATGRHRLGLAGGLFLNCALNGHLARNLDAQVLPFPVAGDAGAAWGAAAWAHARLSGEPPAPLETLRLGHEIRAEEVRALVGVPDRAPRDLPLEVARRVAAGELVGVARGRAEFGPRALGGRSILATPATLASRDRLNRHKGRERWRPLAPAVLEGRTDLFRDLGRSPWMILTFLPTPRARLEVPGALHVDGTARVQSVARADDPFLHAVLAALAARGEPPVVLNTSLNRPGEPIANDARQALAASRALRLHALVLGDRLVELAPAPGAPPPGAP